MSGLNSKLISRDHSPNISQPASPRGNNSTTYLNGTEKNFGLRSNFFLTHLQDQGQSAHPNPELELIVQTKLSSINDQLIQELKEKKMKIADESQLDLNLITYNYKGHQWEEKNVSHKLKESQQKKKELLMKLNQLDENINILAEKKQNKLKLFNKELEMQKLSPQAQEQNKQNYDKFINQIVLERKEIEKRRKQRVSEMIEKMKQKEQDIKQKEQHEIEEQMKQRKDKIEKNVKQIQDRMQNRQKEKEKFIQDLSEINKKDHLYLKKLKEFEEKQQLNKKEQEKQIKEKWKLNCKSIDKTDILNHMKKDLELQQQRQEKYQKEKQELKQKLKDYYTYEGSTQAYKEVQEEYKHLIHQKDIRKQKFKEQTERIKKLQTKIKQFVQQKQEDLIDDTKRKEIQKRIEYEKLPAKFKVKSLKAHENTYNFKEDKYKISNLNKSKDESIDDEYYGYYQEREEVSEKQNKLKYIEVMHKINENNKNKQKLKINQSVNGINSPDLLGSKMNGKTDSTVYTENLNNDRFRILSTQGNDNDGQIATSQSVKNLNRKELIKKGNDYMQTAKKQNPKLDLQDQIKVVIKKKNFSEYEKIQKVKQKANKLEDEAKKKEQLIKIGGSEDPLKQEDEIDNMYINSIKAKLALIQK